MYSICSFFVLFIEPIIDGSHVTSETSNVIPRRTEPSPLNQSTGNLLYYIYFKFVRETAFLEFLNYDFNRDDVIIISFYSLID